MRGLRQRIKEMDHDSYVKLYNLVNWGFCFIALAAIWLLPLPYNWGFWMLFSSIQMGGCYYLSKTRYS